MSKAKHANSNAKAIFFGILDIMYAPIEIIKEKIEELHDREIFIVRHWAEQIR